MMERAIATSLIGNSEAMQHVRELIARIAPSPLPVLIQGPTGSGKELVARALHAASGRRGPFIAFNVAAVSESLFEGALFGHVKGAFSGAVSNLPGFLLEADAGTCFMDEIGSAPSIIQPKLLRALDEGDFRPLGAQRDRHSDFRLVTATSESILELRSRGTFRHDLAYRLQGIVINVPSLKERPDDIPELVEHFAARCASAPEAQVRFSPAALAMLQDQPWPGNVRELKYTIERIAILTNGSPVDVNTLRKLLAETNCSAELAHSSSNDERETLRRLLEDVNWNRTHAARRLDLHPITVYRRMKRLGIARPDNGAQTRGNG